MVSPSAVCTVNGQHLPISGTSGINVAAGSVITIALDSIAGVETWDVNCTMSDGTNPNSAFSLIEATKLLNNTNFTCQFTMPNYIDMGGGSPHVTWNVGASLQFVSVVNAGKFNQNVFTFGVFVIGDSTLRLVFDGENLETDATYGVAPDINQFLLGRALGPAGLGGGDLRGLYPNPYVYSISGYPLGNTINVYAAEFEWAAGLNTELLSQANFTIVATGGGGGGLLNLTTGSNFVLSPNTINWTPLNSNDLVLNAVSQNGQLPNGTSLTINSGSGNVASAPGGGITLNTGSGFGAGAGGDFTVNTGNGAAGAYGQIILELNSNTFLTASNAGGLVLTYLPFIFNGSTFTVNGAGMTVNATSDFVGASTFNGTALFNQTVTFGASADIAWATGASPVFDNLHLIIPDADYTLTSSQYNYFEIQVTQSSGLSASRDLIFPLSGTHLIHNGTNKIIRARGATGTAYSIGIGQSAIVWSDGTNFYGSGANSGITWADDLAGSTDIDQFVVGITGNGASVAIHCPQIIWDGGALTNPSITQGVTGSSSGTTMTIQAQGATSSSSFHGGYLNLSSGTSALGAAGNVNIQTGGVNQVVVDPSNTTFNGNIFVSGFGIAGVVHNLATGQLTSSLIVNADVSSSAAVDVSKLAPGSNGQVLETVAGVPTWSSVSSLLTWNGDLVGSNNSVQWVAAISGQGGTGVMVPLHTSELQFDSTQITPLIDQATTSLGAGQILRIKAQDTSHTSSNGGNLVLQTGDSTGGGGTPGNLQLVIGPTTQLTLTTGQLQWTNNITNPVINQASSTGAANNLTISAQTTTGAGLNGGDLYLSSGAPGAGGTAGAIHLQLGGTDYLRISASNITLPLFSTAGVIHNDASGNLSTSLIINADVDNAAAIAVSKLAAGSNSQILLTNGSLVPTWATVSQDVSIGPTGIVTVTGLQTNPVQSGTLGGTQNGYVLTWVNSSNQWQAQPPDSVIATGAIYQFANVSSDISGYDELVRAVSGSEADLSVSITSGSGTTLIKAFSTNLGVPDITYIQAGIWDFDHYAYVSSTSGGNSNLVFDVYIRTAGGSETLLFSVNGPTITSTSVNEYTASYFQPTDTIINLTDRIVVKVSAVTTASASRTVHFVFDGTTHVSHTHTPIVGAAFTLSGDVTGTTGNTTVVKINGTSVPATPSANQVLVATSGTSATWQQIANAQVSNTAAIDGSKINPNFGSQSLTAGTSTLGATTISGTPLQFGNSIVSPTITQQAGPLSGSDGQPLTVQAQADGGSFGGSHGGHLNLSSGTSTLGTAGTVNIQTGTVTRLSISPANITIAAFSTAGVVHNDASGNLSSSLIAVGTDITPGTADQLLDTNHAGTAAEWFTAGGDVSYASHNFTVTGLQGIAVPTPSGSSTVLTYNAGTFSWGAGGGGGGGVANVAPVTSYTANQTLVHGTDYFVLIGTLTSSITITLPASPTTGDRYEIKNGNNSQILRNDGGTPTTVGYSTTITPTSGTIDGQASYVMTQPYDHITVTYNGSEWSIS